MGSGFIVIAFIYLCISNKSKVGDDLWLYIVMWVFLS